MQKRHSYKSHSGKSLTSNLRRSSSKNRVQLAKPKGDGIKDGLDGSSTEIPTGSAKQPDDLRNPNVKSLEPVASENRMDDVVDFPGPNPPTEVSSLKMLNSEANESQVGRVHNETGMEPQKVVEGEPEVIEPVVPVDGTGGDSAATECGVGDVDLLITLEDE